MSYTRQIWNVALISNCFLCLIECSKKKYPGFKKHNAPGGALSIIRFIVATMELLPAIQTGSSCNETELFVNSLWRTNCVHRSMRHGEKWRLPIHAFWKSIHRFDGPSSLDHLQQSLDALPYFDRTSYMRYTTLHCPYLIFIYCEYQIWAEQARNAFTHLRERMYVSFCLFINRWLFI